MTLPQQIADRIFAGIARDAYASGDRVREETLAERFEVSRGPVREALRILEKDAVVRTLPNKGAHVTQLSAEGVRDIFEIRRKLSGAAISRPNADQAASLATAFEPDIQTLDVLARIRMRAPNTPRFVPPQPRVARSLHQ